nr:MAG TPA: hypothetical protein [Caudoviricetes sp.]
MFPHFYTSNTICCLTYIFIQQYVVFFCYLCYNHY